MEVEEVTVENYYVSTHALDWIRQHFKPRISVERRSRDMNRPWVSVTTADLTCFDAEGHTVLGMLHPWALIRLYPEDEEAAFQALDGTIEGAPRDITIASNELQYMAEKYVLWQCKLLGEDDPLEKAYLLARTCIGQSLRASNLNMASGSLEAKINAPMAKLYRAKGGLKSFADEFIEFLKWYATHDDPFTDRKGNVYPEKLEHYWDPDDDGYSRDNSDSEGI